MKQLSFVLFSLICFIADAQETSNSRRAVKAYRASKSSVAIQDLASAKVYLNSALKYDSKFVEAWILLGDVHIGLGDKLNGIEA